MENRITSEIVACMDNNGKIIIKPNLRSSNIDCDNVKVGFDGRTSAPPGYHPHYCPQYFYYVDQDRYIWVFKCQDGLVWNQDICQCDWSFTQTLKEFWDDHKDWIVADGKGALAGGIAGGIGAALSLGTSVVGGAVTGGVAASINEAL